MATSTRNKVAWVVFALLAIAIGSYPLLYFLSSGDFGLLAGKPVEISSNQIWRIAFYGHIIFGGLALLTGWSQFSKKLRSRKLNLHRNLGKIYVVAVLISGSCGVYIGFFADGGLIPALGFICLGMIWLYTTLRAYMAIRKKDLSLHQGMMIYSYAACFAAVTLRIWMPILIMVTGQFLISYRIVAWLCWIPNMIFAHLWVRRKGLTLD